MVSQPVAAFFLAVLAVVRAQTTMTGDEILGARVIRNLNVSDVPVGRHRFWFKAIDDGIGGYHKVPVVVVKGGDGPVLFLQAALNGDELQGIQVIHQIVQEYNASDLNGTIVGIPGANPTGLINHSSEWRSTTHGLQTTNLNEVMPGNRESEDSGARFAFALWRNLYGENPSVFVDLHTRPRGEKYPFAVFADRRNATVDTLAQLIPADLVKDGQGVTGSVETEMVARGIPAITLQLGSPKVYNADMTKRGVQGIKNIMIHLGILSNGEIDMLGVQPFPGNGTAAVRARDGGFTETLVNVNDEVAAGQIVARQRNPFGDITREYEVPVAGRVLSVSTDPIREPGAVLVRVLRTAPGEDSATEEKADGGDGDDAEDPEN